MPPLYLQVLTNAAIFQICYVRCKMIISLTKVYFFQITNYSNLSEEKKNQSTC